MLGRRRSSMSLRRHSRSYPDGYDRFVERTHNSLLIASIEASRAVADPSVCQALIGSLQGPDFSWLRFDILDARGIVQCSSAPEDVGTDRSDLPEVINARADGHASRGEYAWVCSQMCQALPWPRFGTGRTGKVEL